MTFQVEDPKGPTVRDVAFIVAIAGLVAFFETFAHKTAAALFDRRPYVREEKDADDD